MCVYIYIYIERERDVYIYIYIYIFIYLFIYIYIYIHTHTCIIESRRRSAELRRRTARRPGTPSAGCSGTPRMPDLTARREDRMLTTRARQLRLGPARSLAEPPAFLAGPRSSGTTPTCSGVLTAHLRRCSNEGAAQVLQEPCLLPHLARFAYRLPKWYSMGTVSLSDVAQVVAGTILRWIHRRVQRTAT